MRTGLNRICCRYLRDNRDTGVPPVLDARCCQETFSNCTVPRSQRVWHGRDGRATFRSNACAAFVGANLVFAPVVFAQKRSVNTRFTPTVKGKHKVCPYMRSPCRVTLDGSTSHRTAMVFFSSITKKDPYHLVLTRGLNEVVAKASGECWRGSTTAAQFQCARRRRGSDVFREGQAQGGQTPA